MPDAFTRSLGSRRGTPQNEPTSGEQVKNSAGGFVFPVTDRTRVSRFLTLGTEGGTYYVKEQELTKDNAKFLVALAKKDSSMLVDEIAAVSAAGRAPRNTPALLALAVAASHGSTEYKRLAHSHLAEVARTGHHLLNFVEYALLFRGWGRGLTKAVGAWYNEQDAESLAYQLLKYKSRGKWSQRDVLRLCKFGRTPVDPVHRALYRYVMQGEVSAVLPPLVHAAEKAHATRSVKTWVKLVQDNPLSWEMLPSEALKEADVWAAMLPGMPLGALLRNLPRFTNLGLLSPFSFNLGLVVGRLTDAEALRKARTHPVAVLLALKTYALGHSLRGESQWQPVTAVTDALDEAFYKAFPAVQPSGKRILVALDVSGSMGAAVSGYPFSAREVSAAMSLVAAKTEPGTHFMAFSDNFVPLDISARQRLDTVVRKVSGLRYGATDCAVPMLWAKHHNIEADVFQVWTDNETWYGHTHPNEALRAYRRHTGINARLQVCAVTPTNFSIAEPGDPGQLDVSGFDARVPVLLADHARGDI
jgi:60 kDa SS-A/Ro ribonucleoprotein